MAMHGRSTYTPQISFSPGIRFRTLELDGDCFPPDHRDENANESSNAESHEKDHRDDDQILFGDEIHQRNHERMHEKGESSADGEAEKDALPVVPPVLHPGENGEGPSLKLSFHPRTETVFRQSMVTTLLEIED